MSFVFLFSEWIPDTTEVVEVILLLSDFCKGSVPTISNIGHQESERKLKLRIIGQGLFEVLGVPTMYMIFGRTR